MLSRMKSFHFGDINAVGKQTNDIAKFGTFLSVQHSTFALTKQRQIYKVRHANQPKDIFSLCQRDVLINLHLTKLEKEKEKLQRQERTKSLSKTFIFDPLEVGSSE